MLEPTFQFDTKGNNIVIDDLRAVAIRLSNLIIGRSNGLPSNNEFNAQLLDFISDEASSTTKSLIQNEIQKLAREYISEAVSVNVDYDIADKLSGRKTVIVEATIQTEHNIGVVAMRVGQKGNDIAIEDINVY